MTIIGWPPRRCSCTPPRSTAKCRKARATSSALCSRRTFTLDDAATAELIEKATAVERESVDLYHFTHQLNRSLNEAGRARIIEMMWEIVYADGRRDELEDNLLWRAADLLGVSPQERIALRRRIGGEDIAAEDVGAESGRGRT